MRRNFFLVLLVMLVSYKAFPQEQVTPFTLADRDRIIQTQVEVDALQKEMNGRFEDINKRIDQTNTYIGWLMALFSAITIATFSFALWDRRTMIRPFETKVKEIETNYELKGTKVEKILSSLRELAKTDSKVAEILKNQNLL